jgi:hypothetical protein
MRKPLVLAALTAAVAVGLGAAPSASADFSRTFYGTCTTGTTTYNASLSVHDASAFTPLFVTNSDTGSAMGVLTPDTIILNRVEVLSHGSGLDTSALSGELTTCTFTTRGGTRLFVVTGILAPTIP